MKNGRQLGDLLAEAASHACGCRKFEEFEIRVTNGHIVTEIGRSLNNNEGHDNLLVRTMKKP